MRRRGLSWAVGALLLGAALPRGALAERAAEPREGALDWIEVEGDIDEERVRAAVLKGLPAAERCYRSRAKEVAPLSGEVWLRLLVAPTGRVVGATLDQGELAEGPRPDAELGVCVRRRAMDLRFPASPAKRHSTVRYGLELGLPERAVMSFGILKLLTSPPEPTSVLSSGPEPAGVVGLGAPHAVAGPGKAPTIRAGAAEVRGSLPRETIREVILRRSGQVRICYERELASTPSLAGRLSVSFTIAPDGSTRDVATASSTLGSPAVEACVADVFRGMTFPRPEGGGEVRVTYPYVFSPVADP